MWRWNSSQSRIRFTGGRSAGNSRKNLVKPSGCPIWNSLDRSQFAKPGVLASADASQVFGVFFEGGHQCFLSAQACSGNARDCLEHTLEILRHNFDELRQVLLPQGE